MKSHLVRSASVFCATALFLAAQSTSPVMGISQPSMVLPGGLPPVPGEPVGFWSSFLELNTSQQAAISSILTEQHGELAALRTRLDQASVAIETAQAANSPDSEIDRLATEYGALVAQIAAVQAKVRTKFSSILSPDQRRKLDAFGAMPTSGSREGVVAATPGGPNTGAMGSPPVGPSPKPHP